MEQAHLLNLKSRTRAAGQLGHQPNHHGSDWRAGQVSHVSLVFLLLEVEDSLSIVFTGKGLLVRNHWQHGEIIIIHSIDFVFTTVFTKMLRITLCSYWYIIIYNPLRSAIEHAHTVCPWGSIRGFFGGGGSGTFTNSHGAYSDAALAPLLPRSSQCQVRFYYRWLLRRRLEYINGPSQRFEKHFLNRLFQRFIVISKYYGFDQNTLISIAFDTASSNAPISIADCTSL